MKTLLMDVGNSRIKWGVLSNGEIKRTGHISQARIRETGLQVLTSKIPRRVDDVFVSNVAGTTFATRLSGVVGMHCDCDVRFARTERRGWGVTNGYTQPRRMGVDRWVAMIGAWAEVGAACLVVDAGTAVTVDALNDQGLHLGGQIIPGLRLMGKSLKRDTSGMRDLRIRTGDPGSGMALFADGTANAVRAGGLNAICGAVERAARILRAEGLRPRIVLTGGGAPRILQELDIKVVHRPHLVLQGLAVMLQEAP